ncbi:uncharacterized protein LOC121511736 [Cheilinus undulatus]|uniref:uncharacterized protein LOC121511736 n=1 Tax=Cheilinus undulatus TaxID=241271 RepID=UPI001BD29731|nr:uncharacterized protein LOC121511736 [Cheilinus undulatus]
MMLLGLGFSNLQMPTDVPTEDDRLSTEEKESKCDSMTLSSTPTVRRGSTPLPIKHQLRREEAVHDDADWTSGAAGPSASPIRFSPALDDTMSMAVEGRTEGPLRIALLGQNGVGKSSLALALAGDMDRAASVDSEGEGYVRTVTVDDEESTIIIYDNWRQDLSALLCEVCVLVFSVTDRRSFHRTAQLRLLLRENQPQTPIILVGNKSDLVRTREVTTQGSLTLGSGDIQKTMDISFLTTLSLKICFATPIGVPTPRLRTTVVGDGEPVEILKASGDVVNTEEASNGILNMPKFSDSFGEVVKDATAVKSGFEEGTREGEEWTVAENEDDKLCLICYEDMRKSGGGAPELRCTHRFHKEAARRLEQSRPCSSSSDAAACQGRRASHLRRKSEDGPISVEREQHTPHRQLSLRRHR